MTTSTELLQRMNDFLEGRTSAVLFSYNYPAALAATYFDLKVENPELCALLNEGDLPDDCAWFEPDKAARSGSRDCLDEPALRRKVKDVYEAAIKLAPPTA